MAFYALSGPSRHATSLRVDTDCSLTKIENQKYTLYVGTAGGSEKSRFSKNIQGRIDVYFQLQYWLKAPHLVFYQPRSLSRVSYVFSRCQTKCCSMPTSPADETPCGGCTSTSEWAVCSVLVRSRNSVISWKLLVLHGSIDQVIFSNLLFHSIQLISKPAPVSQSIRFRYLKGVV